MQTNNLLQIYKRWWRTAFDIALIGFTIFLIMLVGSYFYQLALPLIIALPIAAIIRPGAKFLHKRGMKKNTATTITTFFLITILVAVLIALGVIFTSQIYQLAMKMPHYVDFFKNQAIEHANLYQNYLDKVPADVVDKGKEYLGVIAQKASSILSGILLGIFKGISSVSAVVVNFVLGIVLAYFLCIEMDDWKLFAKKKTPNTLKKAFFFLRDNVLTGIGTYIVAQLKLISITFGIVLIGLLVIGAENVLTLSLLSALFDILPLLGVPAIFLPWIIYSLVVGHKIFAIKLGVILGICMITRQLAEPKIAGDALGVSPFLMLLAMSVFLQIFGVAGMLLTPILLILLKQLYVQGYFKKWIRLPESEYSEVSEETHEKTEEKE